MDCFHKRMREANSPVYYMYGKWEKWPKFVHVP